MRIQGKKVWIAGQFMAAQLEIAAGKILYTGTSSSRDA